MLGIPLPPVSSFQNPLNQRIYKRDQFQIVEVASVGPETALSPELTAEQCFEIGVVSEDADKKLACYDQAILLKPDFAAAYHNRGAARCLKGDIAGALEDLNEAIRLQPDHAMAFFNRGFARCDMGDLDGALEDYTEAIRLMPENAAAFNNRALVRLETGDAVGALEDFNEAIRLKPDDPKRLLNRGDLLFESGYTEEALQDYTEEVIRVERQTLQRPFLIEAVLTPQQMDGG